MISIGGIGGFAAMSMRGGREPPSFQSLDSDSSGGISLDEFKAAGPGGGKNAAESARAEKMFAEMDADGDGSVTETEKSTFDSKMQDRMQSMAIMAQLVGSGEQAGGSPAADLISSTDSDGDGAVSADEFTSAAASLSTDDAAKTEELAKALFEAMDADGDGSLTEDEAETYMAENAPKGPPPGPPPGGGMGGGSGGGGSGGGGSGGGGSDQSLFSLATASYSSTASTDAVGKLLESLAA